MARTATASWEAIQEVIKDYLDKPCTTGEIAKWVESPVALAFGIKISSPTIYRLLRDTTTAGIYGLSQVGKDKRWVYSDKTIEKTKTAFVKAANKNEVMLETSKIDREAAQIASLTRNLTDQSMESLINEVEELRATKRAYCKDDIEQAVLDGLRAAVDKYQGGYEQHVKAWVSKPTTDEDWLAFIEMVPELLKSRPDALPILASRFVAAASLVEESESE